VKTKNKKNAKTAIDNRMVEKSDKKQPVGGGKIGVNCRIAAHFEGQNSRNRGHKEVRGDFFRQAGR
jgi:hypothetical protein